MNIATVNVELDQKQLREYVNEKIDDNLRHFFLMIDINKMSELTCMSKSTLENEFLDDARIKMHERKKGKGKRYWLYEPVIAAIKEIMDEW